jgi:hypothetical protein
MFFFSFVRWFLIYSQHSADASNRQAKRVKIFFGDKLKKCITWPQEVTHAFNHVFEQLSDSEVTGGGFTSDFLLESYFLPSL